MPVIGPVINLYFSGLPTAESAGKPCTGGRTGVETGTVKNRNSVFKQRKDNWKIMVS